MFFLALLFCVAGLAHVPWLSTHIVESRTETLVWISSAILEVDWMADCALCVGGMCWLACLLWGEPVLRPWGPRFRGVLYLGRTGLPPEALAFPGLFVPSGIWFFSWGLMPGCLWSMWAWGKQIAVPACAVLDTDLQLFPLSSAYFCLLPSLIPLAQSPEPSVVPGQIGSPDSFQHSNKHSGFQLL